MPEGASAPEQVIVSPSEVIGQPKEIPVVSGLTQENTSVNEQPKVAEAPQEATTAVPKLQNFLTEFNIPFDKLSQPLKDQYGFLVEGKDEQGNEMDSMTYKRSFENFIEAVKNSQELGLKPEQQKKLEIFKTFINSEDVNFDQLVLGLKGHVESSKALNTEQKIEANQTIDELSEAQKKGDEPKVKEKTKKLFNILKYVGIAILVLFGISLFKSFGEMSGTGR